MTTNNAHEEDAPTAGHWVNGAAEPDTAAALTAAVELINATTATAVNTNLDRAERDRLNGYTDSTFRPVNHECLD